MTDDHLYDAYLLWASHMKFVVTPAKTTRQAYVARHPFLPGAYAYLNAKQVEEGRGIDTVERWLEQGAIVAKVPLEQAVHELHQHIAARRAPPEDLPVFLRKQAD